MCGAPLLTSFELRYEHQTEVQVDALVKSQSHELLAAVLAYMLEGSP